MSNRAESFLMGLIGDGVAPSLTPPVHEREGDVQGLRYLHRAKGSSNSPHSSARRSKTVQLWTMGHARAISNEEFAEDPRRPVCPQFPPWASTSVPP